LKYEKITRRKKIYCFIVKCFLATNNLFEKIFVMPFIKKCRKYEEMHRLFLLKKELEKEEGEE